MRRSEQPKKLREQTAKKETGKLFAATHPPERCHTSEAELFTDEVFGALQAVSVTKKFVHAFKSLRLYESYWQAIVQLYFSARTSLQALRAYAM